MSYVNGSKVADVRWTEVVPADGMSREIDRWLDDSWVEFCSAAR